MFQSLNNLAFSYCLDSQPGLFGLFDFSIAPPLLFYSYIPILIVSIFLCLLVFKTIKKIPAALYFFGITASFSFWILLILLQWTAVNVEIVHLSWQLLIIPEILLYVFSVFFCFSYLYQKDVHVLFKNLLFLILVGISVILPTTFNISSFDLLNCESSIGIIWDYVYIFELLTLIIVALISFERFYNGKSWRDKKQAMFFFLGVSLFLGIFWASNFFGEITQTYEINLIGPVGMVLFLSFLSYTVITFKTFKLKIFTSQILIFALAILVFALLFIQNIQYVHTVVLFTFLLVAVVGYELIKSIKREIEQKEEIEQLALNLERANEKLKELDQMKSQFLSFASHQIRSPLTAIKGYSSMLLEGDYGKMPAKISEAIKIIDTSTQSLIVIVNEFLDVSRIEQGRMKYEFTDFDIRKLVEEVVAEQKPNVEKKGLALSYTANQNATYSVHADMGKIKQVLGNVLDNAIKYTLQGSISVNVEKNLNKIHVSITDTGVGLDPEDISKLFSMFSRAKDASKANVSGTGLGLYVAKQMLEAQKGKIWVESQGKGKGSTFHIEIEEK